MLMKPVAPGQSWEGSEPLWKRVPTRDDDGTRLSDFMMIIPKLRKRPRTYVQRVVEEIQCVLHHYHHVVVFADLNLELNVLWVSIKPVVGMCTEIPAAIKSRVPEALLIAQKLEP
jgi:hypothetical protein